MAYNDVKSLAIALGGSGRPHSKNGDCMARCPCHNDSTESLSINWSAQSSQFVYRCFAGCTGASITAHLVDNGFIETSKAGGDYKARVWREFYDAKYGKFGGYFDSFMYVLKTITPYHDEDGRCLGYEVRFDPKTFRQYTIQPDGSNKAKCEFTGIPYRFPEIIAAAKRGDTIHAFEGAKDANNALEFELEATSFASATKPIDLGALAKIPATNWVVWGDNDGPGRPRASEIAKHLHARGNRVKVVFTPIGKDFSDWKQAGATIEQIQALVEKEPIWQPAQEMVATLQDNTKLPVTNYTIGSEAFAGEYVSRCFREELRYVPEVGYWFNYNGKIWEQDIAGEHHEKVKSLSAQIKLDMQRVPSDQRAPLDKLADKVETDSGRRAVINCAKTVRSLRMLKDAFDDETTKHLLPCQNGVLNLREGRLEPFRADLYMTKISPISVDMDNEPDWFKSFVGSMFSDTDTADWLYQFLGYCLTGETSWQRFVLAQGEANTGKTQLTKIMKLIMGDFYGDIDASSLISTRQRSAGTDSDVASISGTRLVVASELSQTHKLDEQLIKRLCGEDEVRAKLMRENKTSITARAKMFFTANEMPPLSDDKGIARRLVLLPFNIKPAKIIPSIGEKIFAEEGPQILGFLAKKARRYYDNPSVLDLPDAIQEATDEMVEEIDPIGLWHQARCAPCAGIPTPVKYLYSDFETWCKDNRYDPMTVNSFTRRLTKFGYGRHRDDTTRYIKGVMLRG